MTADRPTQDNSQSGIPWWKLHLRSLAAGVLAVVVVAASGVYLGGFRTASSSHSVTTTTSSATVSKISTTSTLPPVGTGYLATGASFVDFIQWNNSSGNLSGSEQTVNTTGNTPNLSTTSGTFRVTGSLDGSTISLSFDGSNGGAAVFGTATEESVVLNFPQSDGTLAPITFLKADAAQFNNAVTQLQGAIQEANQSAIQEAQALQEQQLSSIETTGIVIGTMQGSYSTKGASDMKEFTFGQLPLAICYDVSGSSVGTLSYEIGFSQYNPIYDSSGATASSNTSGCVLDPGNDSGQETFDVAMSGTGSYSVTVKQQRPVG